MSSRTLKWTFGFMIILLLAASLPLIYLTLVKKFDRLSEEERVL